MYFKKLEYLNRNVIYVEEEWKNEFQNNHT